MKSNGWVDAIAIWAFGVGAFLTFVPFYYVYQWTMAVATAANVRPVIYIVFCFIVAVGIGLGIVVGVLTHSLFKYICRRFS